MPSAQRSKGPVMISALRARAPMAALVVAALAALGQPQPAVQVVAQQLGADPVRGLVGDDAGAFTPILDPDDSDDPAAHEEADERDRAGHQDSSDSDRQRSGDRREGSESSQSSQSSQRGRGWDTAEVRVPSTGRQRAPELDGTGLAGLIEEVTDADGYRYGARDNAGSTMDTAKVIDKPGGGYLVVYHTNNVAKLATSTDLKTWRFQANLDPAASRPTILATSDGGYLVALETGTGHRGQIRILHYRDLTALQAGRANRTFTAARTLSDCNEGTPSISSAKLSPDIDHSVIELGMHYHRGCATDREATARLTDFRWWKATAAPGTDDALSKAAAAAGKTISGNIADRDTLAYGGTRYSLTEVQYVRGQLGTWRTYLYDATTGRARPLNIRTHRGSRAFANPTVSRITAPNGRPAIVVGLYLPTQAAAPGEAGELLYYRLLPGSSSERPRALESRTRAGSTSTRTGGTP